MKLTSFGQINTGDKIRCLYKGKPATYTAKKILNPGTEHEEVIINIKKNKYFITSMAIDGTSWAKSVEVMPDLEAQADDDYAARVRDD